MNDIIVHRLSPITLIGGGQSSAVDLDIALTLAPTCVAADGGAALAIAHDVPLTAVIGDFDSFDPVLAGKLPKDVKHLIKEQDSTDFEKALTRLLAPVILGIGFSGGRIDHQLAAFHTLLHCAHQPCVLLGESEVVFIAPPSFKLEMAQGETVSLFPLVPVQGRSEGLRWQIEGLAFEPGQTIGTSNIAEGAITLAFDAPGMLTILPRAYLSAVIRQLSQPHDARWPVRAA